jgi:hypothetical protein
MDKGKIPLHAHLGGEALAGRRKRWEWEKRWWDPSIYDPSLHRKVKTDFLSQIGGLMESIFHLHTTASAMKVPVRRLSTLRPCRFPLPRSILG